jgi:hypothetical protein
VIRLAVRITTALVLTTTATAAQQPNDPRPFADRSHGGRRPGKRDEVRVGADVGGKAARMMLLVDEPGTRRLFVNDMRGPPLERGGLVMRAAVSRTRPHAW